MLKYIHNAAIDSATVPCNRGQRSALNSTSVVYMKNS